MDILAGVLGIIGTGWVLFQEWNWWLLVLICVFLLVLILGIVALLYDNSIAAYSGFAIVALMVVAVLFVGSMHSSSSGFGSTTVILF